MRRQKNETMNITIVRHTCSSRMHFNSENLPYVVLRGPIVYLKSCEMFILLATCVYALILNNVRNTIKS